MSGVVQQSDCLIIVNPSAAAVDASVVHEDPRGTRAHSRELQAQARWIVAGVDDGCLRRTTVAAYDVAVGLVRTHHEAVDDEGHRPAIECIRGR